MNTETNVNALDALPALTIHVRVSHTRHLQWRLCLGGFLLRVAARVLRCKIQTHIERTARQVMQEEFGEEYQEWMDGKA